MTETRGQTEAALREEIARLRQELEEARSANSAKEVFLSNMSHDIRTPMNAIVGMTALAKKHIDEKPRVMDALNKIETASGHLLGLVNDVLDMSRINSGRMKLSVERFSLSDLLHDIQIIILPQMEQKQHTWRLTAEDLEAEVLVGDPLRLRQIFVNIINNAVKYTPDGGEISLDVTESLEGETCRLTFVCRDNGIGMTEEFLQRIFEPFERAGNTTRSGIEGTGLGMSIVRKMVDAMAGDIRVESAPGKGTTVTVTIPLAFERETSRPEALEGKKILILEADENQRRLFERYLAGISATVVSSAAEALSALVDADFRGEHFDLILIGQRQENSGSVFDIAEYLHRTNPALPLVLASRADWDKIEYQANRCGIRAFIPLPFFRGTLLNGLADALRGGGESGGAMEAPDLSGKRILLVEDNLINREIAREILSITNAQVDTAENGALAVEAFLAEAPHAYSLILMDVQMPVMDGYAATRNIRNSGREDAASVPIYAMTANTFAEDVARAMDEGMNGHIAKPIDLNALMRVLRQL